MLSRVVPHIYLADSLEDLDIRWGSANIYISLWDSLVSVRRYELELSLYEKHHKGLGGDVVGACAVVLVWETC